MPFDVWEIIASVFTAITAILLVVPTYDIIYNRWFRKPDFRVTSYDFIIVPFQIGIETGQYVRVGLYVAYIYNKGRASALEPIPCVSVDGKIQSTQTCWVGSHSAETICEIEAPPVNIANESRVAEIIKRFLRNENKPDKIYMTTQIPALLFFTIEGHQRFYLPFENPMSYAIPSQHTFGVSIVGEFESRVLDSRTLFVESWDRVLQKVEAQV